MKHETDALARRIEAAEAKEQAAAVLEHRARALRAEAVALILNEEEPHEPQPR